MSIAIPAKGLTSVVLPTGAELAVACRRCLEILESATPVRHT